MTVTITGKVTDVTARKDSRPWKVWSPVYRQGVNGEIITVTGQSVKVVGGVVTIELEPGAAVIENPDGQRYTVTIPDEDADLWGVIATAVAFPPNTEAEALASAVNAYLDDNPPAADWNGLINMPAVIAEGATQAAARAAIGAGEQPLVDTAANLAASNPIPAVARRVRETDTGRWKTGDGTTHYNDLPYDADVVAGYVAGHKLFQKFTKRADSAGVPNMFDSGQAATTVAIGTNAQQYVSGGRLRCTPTGGGAAAGYYTANLSAQATRIGGKFVFIPHSTLGGVATVAITKTQYVTTLPRIGLHLVISPTNWILGYAPNTTGTVTIVASNNFAEPLLVDGVTEYTTEVVLVGTNAYVLLPDGTRQVVSWTAGAADLGPGVFFEHFSTVANTDNEVAFTEVWADTGQQKIPVIGGLPNWRYAKGNTVVDSTPVAANTTVNIPNLAFGNIVAPPSGKVLVRFRWFHLLPNSCDILAQCAVNGTTSAFVAQFLAKGVTGDRELNAEFLITGLTPGGIYAFTPSVQTTAASSIYNWPSSGYNAMSRFEPVS